MVLIAFFSFLLEMVKFVAGLSKNVFFIGMFCYVCVEHQKINVEKVTLVTCLFLNND